MERRANARDLYAGAIVPLGPAVGARPCTRPAAGRLNRWLGELGNATRYLVSGTARETPRRRRDLGRTYGRQSSASGAQRASLSNLQGVLRVSSRRRGHRGFVLETSLGALRVALARRRIDEARARAHVARRGIAPPRIRDHRYFVGGIQSPAERRIEASRHRRVFRAERPSLRLTCNAPARRGRPGPGDDRRARARKEDGASSAFGTFGARAQIESESVRARKTPSRGFVFS